LVPYDRNLCLDWCACHLLCYALVRIKLISLGAYENFGMLEWLLCLLHFYAFTHMHCCTSYRYASWNMWRMWRWSQTRRWCLVDPSQRWKNWKVLGREVLAKQVSSDKPWLESDLRQAPEHYKTPYFSKKILYMCYMYCCITYRSWVKTLLHRYHSLSKYMNLNPM
jgi:hypothetical protein